MGAAGSCAKVVAMLVCTALTASAASAASAAGTPANAVATATVASASADSAAAEPAGALDASRRAVPRYRLEPQRSGLTFRVDNFWHAHLTMRFTRMRAELIGGDDDLVASRVDVTVDAASLGANVPFVAALVKGSAMLDVARYPEIRFVGTRFERTGATTGLLSGELTIRATTRPITLAVRFAAEPRSGDWRGGERGDVRIVSERANP